MAKATRWLRNDPRWPKITARWLLGDPKMVLSCKRSANFAKSAMPSPDRCPKGPERAQSGPKRAQDEPRWSQYGPKMAPRWPRDGPKMTPRWPQGDPQMVLSCRRGANFAKSAMPSSVLSPRGPERAQSDPKRAQNEPGSSRDVPRRPEDGPKMVLKRRQDGINGALV